MMILTKSRRVSFFLPPASDQRLERIKEKLDWNKDSEAFRSGLRLLEDYINLLESGATLVKRVPGEEDQPYTPLIVSGER